MSAMRDTLFLKGDKPLLNLVLLLATWVSTGGTYAVMFGGAFSANPWKAVEPSAIFATSMVTILFCHEMGHYLFARAYRMRTSLPYFIPAPFLAMGTLGAVIRLRGLMPSRQAMVEIGAAGPLGGLLVAIPITGYGMWHSTVGPSPRLPMDSLYPQSLWSIGENLWNMLMVAMNVSAEQVMPKGHLVLELGDNFLLLGLQQLIHGDLPPGHAVYAHPMVVAGWFGCLVTMLNLLPLGQLDGGHLTYALLGKRAEIIGKGVSVVLLLLSIFVSVGWLFWFIVTAKVVGYRHPRAMDENTPLPISSYMVCLFCALGFLLTAMPIPVNQVMVP